MGLEAYTKNKKEVENRSQIKKNSLLHFSVECQDVSLCSN